MPRGCVENAQKIKYSLEYTSLRDVTKTVSIWFDPDRKNTVINEDSKILEKYRSKNAVSNVNFKIGENEIVGLLGPNGCGKTTTIGMILGLLKPSNGKVLINGISVEYKRVELLNDINFISLYSAIRSY